MSVVLKLQWNALRVGDHVLVHDPLDAHMALESGVVALVQTAHDVNDLGVRVHGADGAAHIIRPARLTVHLAPLSPALVCWRCAEIAATATAALVGAARR